MAEGTGCNYDYKWTWSGTECSDGMGAYVVKGSGGKTTCAAKSNGNWVRFVVNSESRSECVKLSIQSQDLNV